MDPLVVIVGAVEALVFTALLYLTIAKRKHSLRTAVKEVQNELEQRQAQTKKVESMVAELVDAADLQARLEELTQLSESLKTERGRSTITQAELETVDNRLRDLEEIERELEASSIETKEEIAILEKKQAELQTKNQTLKEQLAASLATIEQLVQEISDNPDVQKQIANMRDELAETEKKISLLIQQISQGNEQYFTLKRRYDALDIEYAQLFEKFSDGGGDGARGS